MTSSPIPPPLAERVLFATIPDGDWRESIAGDLREEFALLSQRRGAGAARRWYWRQTLAIGTRAVVSRVGGNPMPRRNWISLPELDEGARSGAGVTRDLAYALRSVLRRPGTSAVVVLTLALALAANATIFSLMDALVWRPYRFAGADRTVLIASSAPQDSTIDRESVAPGDFADWRREVTRIQHLSAAEWWDANLSGIETPEQIAGFHVTADFFRVFGAAPAIGRGFLREEETRGAHRRVVIAHTLWVRRFASDPTIVGRAIRVDGEPHDVVGVAPQGFSIPLGAEMWAPLANTSQTWSDRRSGYLYVVGRLTEGETMDAARAEVTAIVARQQREYPDTNAKRDVTVTDFTHGMADPGAGPFLSTWQVASLFLLLIACANVANLLLARGAERAQEFAIRLALGAGRGRLASQLVIEGALLSAAATLIAVPLAAIGLGLSRASIPASVIRFLPGWPYMRLSVEVLAATALLATLATLLFSLVPALHAARAGAADIWRQDTRSVTRKRTHLGRTALAALQVALTLALLFGSVLVLSAVREAANGALGFDKHQLLVARMVLPAGPYAQLGARTHFVDTVIDRLRAVPAVSHVAGVSHLPYGGSSQSREFRPEGVDLAPADVRRVAFRTTTPSYFETMRIPLLAGRTFAETDTSEAQAVAIVSKSLAARYWPDVDPIGRRFRLEQDSLLIAVVGVVGDIAQDVDTRGNPMLYRPSGQAQIRPLAIVVRTVGDPLSIAGELRRAVAAADRDQPLIELKPMADLIEDRVAGVTFVGRALSAIAVIAFVLAITGLYSLIAYLASRRTREIGVRVALGARRWQVIRVTTVQALKITAVGIAIGIGLSAAVGRVMESTLLGIVSADWLQLAGLSTLLAGGALVAAYLPARRAASIDPTTALRAD